MVQSEGWNYFLGGRGGGGGCNCISAAFVVTVFRSNQLLKSDRMVKQVTPPAVGHIKFHIDLIVWAPKSWNIRNETCKKQVTKVCYVALETPDIYNYPKIQGYSTLNISASIGWYKKATTLDIDTNQRTPKPHKDELYNTKSSPYQTHAIFKHDKSLKSEGWLAKWFWSPL